MQSAFGFGSGSLLHCLYRLAAVHYICTFVDRSKENANAGVCMHDCYSVGIVLMRGLVIFTKI